MDNGTFSLEELESFLHSRPSHFIIWTAGLFFVTLINLCAIVGIGMMKYFTKSYNTIITLFVGLGVGSLSGFGFYHLLPQAFPQLVEEVDANGHRTHNYLTMAHCSLAGVYMFYLCDNLIKIILEKRQSQNQHCIQYEDSLNDTYAFLTNLEIEEQRSVELKTRKGNANGEQTFCSQDDAFNKKDVAIAAVAWMVIVGDGFHNLIDGISIGASFSESIHSGISISLAVLCEEFPHELGDVAILVAAGMTLRQALFYNLLSAVSCYIGFGMGVVLGEVEPDVAKYAFALAGGMFLYISLGCMMPEMKKTMEEALNRDFYRGVSVLFLQCAGIFMGLSLMYLMARYGEDISI